ncbi:hypothetical protein ACLOJK_017497 [Asimina triloba]
MRSLTAAGFPANLSVFPATTARSHLCPIFNPATSTRSVFRSWVFPKTRIRASAPSSSEAKTSSSSSSPGLYSSQTFELTAENVDLVLEDVRPYLISDGGNVDVVSVEDGIISLKLQGGFLVPSLLFLFAFCSFSSEIRNRGFKRSAGGVMMWRFGLLGSGNDYSGAVWIREVDDDCWLLRWWRVWKLSIDWSSLMGAICSWCLLLVVAKESKWSVC